MTASQELQIQVVSRDDQVAALWLLFAADSALDRRDRVTATVRAATQQKVDFDHLLEARRGDSRVGVVWGQTLPGRNANIWLPSLEADEPATTSERLLAALDSRLAVAGLTMGQLLLPANRVSARDCLCRCAYVKAADLRYLLSPREQFPPVSPETELAFEPFAEGKRSRLESVIEETYIDTQDAPLVDGMRKTADVIAGYQGTGQFAPERWSFVRFKGTDIGCLLLTDHPALRHWELLYMGLVPIARGRRWSIDLVKFAQWQARRAGSEAILVSVDGQNTPAIAAYAQCGFFQVDSCEVWVKRFNDPSSS